MQQEEEAGAHHREGSRGEKVGTRGTRQEQEKEQDLQRDAGRKVGVWRGTNYLSINLE